MYNVIRYVTVNVRGMAVAGIAESCMNRLDRILLLLKVVRVAPASQKELGNPLRTGTVE